MSNLINLRLLFLIASTSFFYSSSSFSSQGRISLNLNVSIGSHETHAKLGLLAFGAVEEANIGIEAGVGLWTQANLKRFGQQHISWSSGYEAFGLAGFGDNRNLLGSSLSSLKNQTFYQQGHDRSFLGLGLGISNEWDSTALNQLLHRNGKVYLRFSKNDNNYAIGFANDVNAGILLSGAAKDYGKTASGDISYTRASPNRIQHYTLGLAFFTPKPDFNKEPNNPINSGEGRKRVWFTSTPYDKLFNGNVYFSTTQINQHASWSASLGVDSKKLAAEIQNDIHDEFGLVPRFPWPIENKDKLLWNVTYSENLEVIK